MASNPARLLQMQKIPTIRKIFRTSTNVYLCGICRSNYQTMHEANSCLNHCWFEVSEFYPLVPRRNAQHKFVYRCRYCSRDYEREEDGLRCASDCKTRGNRLHEIDQNILNLPITPRAKPKKHRPVNVATSFVPKYQFKHKQEEEAIEPTMNNAEPVQEEQPPLQEQQAAPEPEKADEPIDRGKHRSEYKKEWVRKDAKYECCYCQQKYFTRNEVISCFNEHFDEDGYEKEKS